MVTISLFVLSSLALLLSVASIWNSNRLRVEFSRNKLKKQVLELKDDTEYAIRQIQRDWDDTYEKLRSIAGRIDRAKRKGQNAVGLDEMSQGPQPGDPRQQILDIARQKGMIG